MLDRNLKIISDVALIKDMAMEVIEENPKELKLYKDVCTRSFLIEEQMSMDTFLSLKTPHLTNNWIFFLMILELLTG